MWTKVLSKTNGQAKEGRNQTEVLIGGFTFDELGHDFGQRYRYEVRQVTSVLPDDRSVLSHEEYDWVTLITCQGYDEQQDAYRKRMVVRAVLVEVMQP